MENIALQLQCTDALTLAQGDSLNFNENIFSTGEVSYDAVTGVITFFGKGKLHG